MKKETVEALTKYEKAWKNSLNPSALSVIKLCIAFANGKPLSFSDLVNKTRLSSQTVDFWLKRMMKSGFIIKKRQKNFPFRSTYTLNPNAQIVRITGKYVEAFDKLYRYYIEGAGEGLTTVEKLVECVIKHRNECLEFIYSIDKSWLQGKMFEYVQIMCSALNAISFWGTFFTLSFPHIKEKAKKIMQKKGLVPVSEQEMLNRILLLGK